MRENPLQNLKEPGEVLKDVNSDYDPRIIAEYTRVFQREKNFYRVLALIMFIVGFIAGVVLSP